MKITTMVSVRVRVRGSVDGVGIDYRHVLACIEKE